MHGYDVPAAWFDTDYYSEPYSEIPNYTAICPCSNAEYDPE